MDPGFATLNTQQTTSGVPTDIYRLLFDVALHGYDAKDVSMWYQIIRQDLSGMAAQNTQAATSLGLSMDSSLNAQYNVFLEQDCAARRSTLATIDSCISPTIKPNAVPSTEIPSVDGDYAQPGTIYPVSTKDSMSQAYNTPQSYQTYATTPQQLESTPEPPQTQQLMPAWSPAPSSAAEQDFYAAAATASLSNGNLMAFAGEPTNAMPTYPWFSAQDMGSLHSRTHSQQSHLSHHSLPATSQHMSQLPQHHQQPHPQQPYLTPEYNTQLSNTAMPVLVPYASSGGSGNYTKAAAIPAGTGGASLYSSGNGYFPIIHVSSSRRRRKALQKGVKKMVQPLKGRRQQSV